jgi:hypothetical protein
MVAEQVAGIVISILLAGTAWFAHSSGKQSGMQTIQAKWDRERVLTQEAQEAQARVARDKEAAWVARLVQQQTEYQNESKRIAADNRRLVDSLRNRPSRPSGGGVPQAPTPGAEPAPGCTGAQLYRPDGEFLAGESALADQLRSALGVCKAAYESLTQEKTNE